jgi:BirA family biotin operon repressor/biotin-[acetyl-CoA-carboxylase] ligase
VTTSRRVGVVRALAASDAVVSGEALAATLGVSRVAIGKHVGALGTLGFGIDASLGAGYRLAEIPDRCIPEAVAVYARDPLWTGFEGAEELASTNDECARLAREGAAEGTVVVAARQSAGRGRLGRTWSSEGGGVYLSALLRPQLAPADVVSLGLVASLGVAIGLESLGVIPALKWPNDVQLGGRKLAGVLLEMSAEADAVRWVVVGCGINVAPTDAPGAAWVREANADVTIPRVAGAALDGMAEAYRRFLAGGFAALADEYRSRDSLLGSEVEVRDIGGALVASGLAESVDSSGALVVRSAKGAQAVLAGDVTLRNGGSGRGVRSQPPLDRPHRTRYR